MVFKLFGLKNDASQQTPVPVDPTVIFTPSPILRQKIQGFQTITTFLGQIQQRAPIRPYDFLRDQHVTQENRKDILLCDSFAHLAVIHHDVVALATNRRGAELEILACTNTSVEKDKDTPPDDSRRPQNALLKFFFARNTRIDEDKITPVTTHPSIIEAKAPDGYPENDLGRKTLYQYLDDLEGKS
jgi:hypothetical protein